MEKESLLERGEVAQMGRARLGWGILSLFPCKKVERAGAEARMSLLPHMGVHTQNDLG